MGRNLFVTLIYVVGCHGWRRAYLVGDKDGDIATALTWGGLLAVMAACGMSPLGVAQFAEQGKGHAPWGCRGRD